MSVVNKEGADEPDEDSSSSSESSSSSTSCTSSTAVTSTGSSTSTSTASDDCRQTSCCGTEPILEDDELRAGEHRHRNHQQCPTPGSSGGVTERLGQCPSTGHQCDIGTNSRCLCKLTNRSQVPANEQESLCCGFTNRVDDRQSLLSPHLQPHPQTDTGGPSRAATSTNTNEDDTHPKYIETSLNSSATISARLPDSSELNSPKHGSSHIIECTCNIDTTTSLGQSFFNFNPATSKKQEQLEPAETQPSRTALKPTPSPSPSLSTIDTNNNKNGSNSNTRDNFSSIKKSNFSKSASGSRLINKSRASICDCLSRDCIEKKHSNRRQFIEHYYNSRTQLPSANTSTSSFNISTPLNRLSECDAITKRLLSSPIRTTNLIEGPTRRSQPVEMNKSRRASLGTSTMADQVFLFSSDPFKSLELSHSKKNENNLIDNQLKCDQASTQASTEMDLRVKQQQVRSLSVCDEETLNPTRFRSVSSNHSSNLNRAISLACESGSSPAARRMLTIIPLFGCDIRSLEQFTKLGFILPPVIDSVVEHILTNGVNSIGIFRKSGVKSRILSLRQRIESNQNTKFDELNPNKEFSIYDIADLVKMWFRELRPAPLMTKELIKLISATSARGVLIKSGNSSHQEDTPQTSSSRGIVGRQIDPSLRNKIDAIITPTHKALLSRALNFLARISSRSKFYIGCPASSRVLHRQPGAFVREILRPFKEVSGFVCVDEIESREINAKIKHEQKELISTMNKT